MKLIYPVILGLIKKGDKYLFTKRVHEDPTYHAKWQIPGGGLEWGEALIDCLKRELKEELGVTVKNIRLIPHIHESIRPNWHGILIPYLCELENEEQKIVLDDEASDYRWLTEKEVKSLDTLPGCYETLEKVRKM